MKLSTIAALLLFIVVYSSCTKPKDGLAGANGINGINGKDANSSCLYYKQDKLVHFDTTIFLQIPHCVRNDIHRWKMERFRA